MNTGFGVTFAKKSPVRLDLIFRAGLTAYASQTVENFDNDTFRPEVHLAPSIRIWFAEKRSEGEH